MSKNSVIIALLALVALTSWAQSTKTATVTGYSPALKDGTLVFASTGPCASVVDTVQAGRFAYDIETDFPKLYNIISEAIRDRTFVLGEVHRRELSCECHDV